MTDNQKINVLEQLISIVQQDHPEFYEEQTTGWDLLDGATTWLSELLEEKGLPDYNAYYHTMQSGVPMSLRERREFSKQLRLEQPTLVDGKFIFKEI